MRAVLLLLVPLVLSGCVTPNEAPAGDAQAAAPPRSIAWGIEECRFLIAVIRFDPALADGMLPEGFTLSQGDGLPLPAEVDALARASLGVEAFECARGAGLDGEVAPLDYGSFYFGVEPPEALSAGDEAGHYYKLSVLVPDAPRRAWFVAAGADVVGGNVSIEDTAAGRDAVMDMDGIGQVRITSLQVQENAGFTDFPFREFTAARDGLVLWDALASTPGTFNGRALLEVPEGSLPARLMGSTSAVLDVFGGTYTFHNATVTLP